MSGRRTSGPRARAASTSIANALAVAAGTLPAQAVSISRTRWVSSARRSRSRFECFVIRTSSRARRQGGDVPRADCTPRCAGIRQAIGRPRPADPIGTAITRGYGVSRRVIDGREVDTMPSAHRTITIRHPLPEVFAFVADGLNGPKWRPGVLDVQHVSGDGAGAVYRQGVKGPGGRRIAADYEITASEPGRRLAFKAIAGPVRPTGEYRFAPIGRRHRADLLPRGGTLRAQASPHGRRRPGVDDRRSGRARSTQGDPGVLSDRSRGRRWSRVKESGSASRRSPCRRRRARTAARTWPPVSQAWTMSP